MKLDNKEFKLFKDLEKKIKAGKATDEEKAQYEALLAKKNSKEDTGAFKPGNDFSWWNKYPELTEDTANLKCDYIAGTQIGVDIPVVLYGVLLIELESVYGNSKQAVDAINEWARELFLRMFRKYRIPGNYTASDLAIAVIAAIECIKLIAKYERIYGVINRYSLLNKNMPYAEARALGLTINDMLYLQGHMSDFRADLNFLINRAQKVVVMKDISLLADSISLLGYEYLDHENGRAQIITFDTRSFGLYSDTDLQSGGSIRFEAFTSTPMFDFNSDNMCLALETCVNALVSSDSVQKIFADLTVWFGEDAMIHMGPIPENYVTVPVYNESILHKMHNLETFTGPGVQVTSWADPGLSSADTTRVVGSHYLYQCDDRIVSRVAVSVPGVGTGIAYDNGTVLATPDTNNFVQAIEACHMIDTYRRDVNPETVVEGVMWKFNSEAVTDAAQNICRVLTSCSFWVCVNTVCYTVSGTIGGDKPTVYHNSDGQNCTDTAARLALVDWAPLVYLLSASQPYKIANVFGDMDNIVPIYANNIAKIHRVVILSGLKTDVRPKDNAK